MVVVKKMILDVLKPHQPNSLEFSCNLAGVGDDYRVELTVIEVDENTETLQIKIEGSDLNFDAIQSAITEMSGALHSIDIVEVQNIPDRK